MMTSKDVEAYERVRAQLAQLRAEMSILSKSKPDNPINKFKLRLINEKLTSANELLKGEPSPINGFSVFGDADLPTNSDVVMVLSQYLDSLEAFRCANIYVENHQWRWETSDDEIIPTGRPTRYRVLQDTADEEDENEEDENEEDNHE